MKELMNSFMNQYENGFEEYFEQQRKENLLEREDYKNRQEKIKGFKEKYPKIQDFLENDQIVGLKKEEKEAILEIDYLEGEIHELELKEAFKLGFKEAMIYFQEMGMLVLHKKSQQSIDYEELHRKWKEKYFHKELVDLKKYFTDKDFEIISKLGIEIKDKIYTEYEFELLDGEVIDYYKSDDMDEEELKMGKNLEETGVSIEEYNQLLDKIHNINIEYNF